MSRTQLDQLEVRFIPELHSYDDRRTPDISRSKGVLEKKHKNKDALEIPEGMFTIRRAKESWNDMSQASLCNSV